MSKSVFDPQGCRAFTVVLARLSCICVKNFSCGFRRYTLQYFVTLHGILCVIILYNSKHFWSSQALSTLSQKSATVAENGETTAKFGECRTFLRQCGQAFIWGSWRNLAPTYGPVYWPTSRVKTGVKWRERSCQRSCQMETTRRPLGTGGTKS